MFRDIWLRLRAPGKGLWVQAFLLLLLIALLLVLRKMNAPWEGLIGKHLRLGRRLAFDEETYIPFWWSLVIDGLALIALVVLSPLWLRLSQKPESVTPARCAIGRGGVVLLFAGLTLATALRVPRLARTIERDEQDTLRRNILGFVFIEDDGTDRHFELPLKAAFWEDGQANNPFLFSVLARITLRTWQGFSGAEPWRASLPLLRLWAIIPGVLSLAAVWWWLHLMKRPRAAALALFLGAVHPMHVDYSVQARGYAFVMLFVSLALCAGWFALNEGKWRHWLAVAACFLGCMYSAPISLYFAATLGGSLLVTLLWRRFRKKQRDATADITRLTIASVAAAMVFLPLVLPAVEPAMNYIAENFHGGPSGRSGLDAPWPLSSWCKFMSGVQRPDIEESARWDDEGMTTLHFLLQKMLPQNPVLFFMVWITMPAMLVIGFKSLRTRTPGAAPLALAGLAAPFITYTVHHITDTFLYYWYLIYFLPIVIALAAMALDEIADRCGRRFHKPAVSTAIITLFFALFLAPSVMGDTRFNWFPPKASSPEVFDRGRFHWVTYPDGKTRREPIEKPPQAK